TRSSAAVRSRGAGKRRAGARRRTSSTIPRSPSGPRSSADAGGACAHPRGPERAVARAARRVSRARALSRGRPRARARGLRHVRDRLPRPPRPDPHPDARRLGGPPPAQGLPGGPHPGAVQGSPGPAMTDQTRETAEGAQEIRSRSETSPVEESIEEGVVLRGVKPGDDLDVEVTDDET